jgi:hypothetical protein
MHPWKGKIMRFDTNQAALQLGHGQSLRVCGALDVRIDCADGCLWITQDHDIRDIVLQRGESFTLDRPGVAILYACSRSIFVMHGREGRVAPDCDGQVGVSTSLLSPLFA